MQFVSTYTEIQRKEAADKATKKKEVAGTLKEKASDASNNLELNSHNVSSIALDDIKGLIFKVYNKSVHGVQSKLRKPDFGKALERENFVRILEGMKNTLQHWSWDKMMMQIMEPLLMITAMQTKLHCE